MKTSKYNICQDWSYNDGNLKGKILMVHFRLAFLLRSHILFTVIGLPFLIYYRIFIEWVMGVELQMTTQVGTGCRLEHGQGLVVYSMTVIGSGALLRQNVTIGNKKNKDGSYSDAPIIGNNCDLGAGAMLIGEITIGDNVTVGAGCVVVKDVPSNSIVIGNPMRIIPKKL